MRVGRGGGLTTISLSGWAIWIYAVILPIYLAYTWWTAKQHGTVRIILGWGCNLVP